MFSGSSKDHHPFSVSGVPRQSPIIFRESISIYQDSSGLAEVLASLQIGVPRCFVWVACVAMRINPSRAGDRGVPKSSSASCSPSVSGHARISTRGCGQNMGLLGSRAGVCVYWSEQHRSLIVFLAPRCGAHSKCTSSRR